MTLATMRTSVRTRLGRPDSDGLYTDAVLTDFVNEATQAYSTEAEWPWLQTVATISLVAGTKDYANPADWSFTKALYIAPDMQINYLPLAELINYGADIGQPYQYTDVNNQKRFAPVPTTVATVQHIYYKTEPVLSADADTPLIPAQFTNAIVAFALARAYQRANEPGAAAAAMKEYDNWIQRMNGYRRRSSGPIRPSVVRSYGG